MRSATLSPAGAAPWLVDVFGGRQSARSLHFIAAWAIFGFAGLHLALALADWRLIAAMVTGGTRADDTAPEPAAAHAEVPANG